MIFEFFAFVCYNANITKREIDLNLQRIIKKREWFNSPVKIIAVSFAAVIAVGTILLMLPMSAKDGNFTNFVDAFFTATSATCVTGLVVFDTYVKWTVFGQVVILLLIQIGGLGLVTITSFFATFIHKKVRLRSLQLATESVSGSGIADVKRMLRFTIAGVFIVELIGALLLAISFVPKYGAQGVFISIFVSISSFCNAGFDILGMEGEYSSLMNYASDPVVLGTVMALIIIGGLGFIVWRDFVQYRKKRKLELQSKVVLIVTGSLILLGTLCFLTFEWSNPETIGDMSVGGKISNSLFQSVTTRTAGYNTVDNAALTPISKVVSSILMFIGAAPGSTGGGIKIVTFAVIIMTVVSACRGKSDTMVSSRKVRKEIVYKSIAIFFIAIVVVITTTFVIYFTNNTDTQHVSMLDSLFESVSAFATVGLSTGVTSVLNWYSKILMSLVMFIGRVGPITFALALTMRDKEKAKSFRTQSLQSDKFRIYYRFVCHRQIRH